MEDELIYLAWIPEQGEPTRETELAPLRVARTSHRECVAERR